MTIEKLSEFRIMKNSNEDGTQPIYWVEQKYVYTTWFFFKEEEWIYCRYVLNMQEGEEVITELKKQSITEVVGYY